MAIRLVDQYPNRVGTPDADYPHGVPRNRSAPGAVDGTPFEQAWFRDQEGFFQGLLETAGITPSGSPDTVEQSDYLDALTQAMHGVIEVNVGGDADVTLGIYPSRMAALRLTGVLGADVDLIVPDAERLYTIIDETTGGFSVTVRTDAGVGVALSGGASIVRSDGDDVVRVNVKTAADEVSYDNTSSGLTATTDQAAIDEAIFLLGKSRTWQDVTASRTAGVIYTNSTGREIFVLISVDTSQASTLTINGITIPLFETAGVVPITFSFIVPDGGTYGTSDTGSGKWLELR